MQLVITCVTLYYDLIHIIIVNLRAIGQTVPEL